MTIYQMQILCPPRSTDWRERGDGVIILTGPYIVHHKKHTHGSHTLLWFGTSRFTTTLKITSQPHGIFFMVVSLICPAPVKPPRRIFHVPFINDCLFTFHQQSTKTLASGYFYIIMFIWKVYFDLYTSKPFFIIMVTIEVCNVAATLLSAVTIKDSDHTQLQGLYHMTTARQSA